ncbi:MAG: dihydrodipicolinate synthase family protein [Candidatus Dormibacteraeota bacterium]|nr:dihydrodipicolinate synthase family protein [Candidatus Dormibacteraeota bacterium]
MLPTFTGDLQGLNEAAIRHDVCLEKKYGVAGILIVSECGTNRDELVEFIRIAVDESGDDLVTLIQASEATVDDMVAVMRMAEELGVDMVLPSYPLYFHPSSHEDIFDLTKKLADSTYLGVMVFAIDQWNFSRLHPAAFPRALLDRMVETIPTIVAIKNEIGGPGVGGIAEIFETFNQRVVVTDPMEANAPAWVRAYGMRVMGTSNYESMADQVPRMLALLQDTGTFREAMEIYWKMAPVRRANAAVMGPLVAQGSLVPRMFWKYQSWLVGYNGGPIRQPHARPTAAHMATLRNAAVAAGLPVCGEDDAAFFTGRIPAP